MNRPIRFSGYLLLILVLFSIFTVTINGGGGIDGREAPDSSGPNSAVSSTPTPPAKGSNQYYEQKFTASLRSAGITVLSVDTQSDIVVLRYTPRKANKSVVVGEMGVISVRYASLIRNGWDVSQLEAKVIPPREQPVNNSSDSPNGSRQPVATWHVKTEWVENMEQKNASEEYLQKILNSIEVKD